MLTDYQLKKCQIIARNCVTNILEPHVEEIIRTVDDIFTSPENEKDKTGIDVIIKLRVSRDKEDGYGFKSRIDFRKIDRTVDELDEVRYNPQQPDMLDEAEEKDMEQQKELQEDQSQSGLLPEGQEPGQEPNKKKRGRKKKSETTISEDQVKRLFAIAGTLAVDKIEIDEYLLNLNISSIAEITVDKYDGVIAWIEGHAKKNDATGEHPALNADEDILPELIAMAGLTVDEFQQYYLDGRYESTVDRLRTELPVIWKEIIENWTDVLKEIKTAMDAEKAAAGPETPVEEPEAQNESATAGKTKSLIELIDETPDMTRAVATAYIAANFTASSIEELEKQSPTIYGDLVRRWSDYTKKITSGRCPIKHPSGAQCPLQIGHKDHCKLDPADKEKYDAWKGAQGGAAPAAPACGKPHADGVRTCKLAVGHDGPCKFGPKQS